MQPPVKTNNSESKNQLKHRRFHVNSKWNSLVENWPGHVIFQSFDETSGLRKALKRHGFQPFVGQLADGRVKVWRG